MKELPVILSTLLRNKAIWFLTIFQVALTLAVLINSYASIDGYGNIISDDMGIAQHKLIAIESEILNAQAKTDAADITNFYKDRILQNFDRLKQSPDIQQISITNGFPVSDNAQSRRVKQKHEDKISIGITLYTADENFLSTLSIPIVAGRNFNAADVTWSANAYATDDKTPIIIITQALADKLYPDSNPLNQQISIDDEYFSITGIVDRMPGLHPLWSNVELSAFIPGRIAASQNKFLVRIKDNADIHKVIADIEKGFTNENELPQFFSIFTLDELKSYTLITASATLKILGFITVLLLVVSAFGIYGQTSFNVAKKTKETGIKRAIGATRGDILSYYLTENWLITSCGIAMGLILAFILNFILIQGLGATKIDLNFILPCIVFLWLVGLSATYFPARRAANIPPVHATRTV